MHFPNVCCVKSEQNKTIHEKVWRSGNRTLSQPPSPTLAPRVLRTPCCNTLLIHRWFGRTVWKARNGSISKNRLCPESLKYLGQFSFVRSSRREKDLLRRWGGQHWGWEEYNGRNMGEREGSYTEVGIWEMGGIWAGGELGCLSKSEEGGCGLSGTKKPVLENSRN